MTSSLSPVVQASLIVALWLLFGTTSEGAPLQTHHIQSPYQSKPTLVRVLMPDTLQAGKKYPVLYILPVEAGTEKKYGQSQKEAQKHDLANRYQIVCVFPTFCALPWYANHPTDKKLQQETYFLENVIPLVEQNYPVTTDPQGRHLIGFSKSGRGAWSLLLRHPDKFHKAMAMDAPLMLEELGKYGSKPIFATNHNFEEYNLSQLAAQQAKQFQGEPRLYHWAGETFREHHQKMETRLSELDITSVFQDRPHYKHHWESGWLSDAVKLLLKRDNQQNRKEG